MIIYESNAREQRALFFSPSIPNDLEGAANNNNNNQHARAAAAAAAAIVQYIVVGRNNSKSSRRGDEDATALCFLPVTVSLTQPFAWGILSPTGSRRTLSRYLWLESKTESFPPPLSQVKCTHTTKNLDPKKTSYFHFCAIIETTKIINLFDSFVFLLLCLCLKDPLVK
jgi:hypothetical protein